MKDPDTIELPILIISFAGSSRILKQINSLKSHKVNRIYLSQDGPKCKNSGTTAQDEKILSELNSFCPNVIIRKLPENLGSRTHCVDAINWFFEHEEYGLILEDDVTLHAKTRIHSSVVELLTEQIFAICLYGNKINDQVITAPFFGSWGWIGSRKKWQARNMYLAGRKTSLVLNNEVAGSKLQGFFWRATLRSNANKDVPHWDFDTQHYVFNRNLSCAFTPSLVANFGFENDYTNTKRRPLNYIWPLNDINIELNNRTPVRAASEKEVRVLCWTLFTFPFDFHTLTRAVFRKIHSHTIGR
jgi:hypothetical protein